MPVPQQVVVLRLNVGTDGISETIMQVAATVPAPLFGFVTRPG